MQRIEKEAAQMRLTLMIVSCAVLVSVNVCAQQNTYPWPQTGNVGIGTTIPGGILGIGGASIPMGITTEVGGTTPLLNVDLNFRETNKNTAYPGAAVRIDARSPTLPLIQFLTRPANGTESVSMAVTETGNVGIGTTSPGAKLEVSGGIKLTQGSAGVITFQDGTQQSTAFSPVLCGGDYAESVNVTGDRVKYEPGDVLVIDQNNPGKFQKSTQAYSTSVMGVYSTKPGLTGRRQTTPKSVDEVPMAMVGIIPIKVSAENGSIRPGDLLVTSSTAGYAMKGTDRSNMLGAVIGKALGNLDSGTGVIEAGITLQ